MSKIQRALISVSDKRGIVALARALDKRKIEILSTGGTAKLLSENSINVKAVSEYTGFPEILDGRVKTLHPKIHGGLLGRRDLDSHVNAMKQHDIGPIDMVVVNLYPFERVTARSDCTLDDAIEHIDIGGPAMLRSAAKNYAYLTVVVDSMDYDQVLAELNAKNGSVGDELRYRLAVKAFEHTARYDGVIANYLGGLNPDGECTTFPHTFNMQYAKAQDMRYGENPHQSAAFYIEVDNTEASITTAKQLQGKALSFNNVADTDAALECVKCFGHPACVIVKHANPCGVAVADRLSAAYDLAYHTDPTSAFGGIIACNRPLDAETAKTIIDRQFVEVIIAPRVNDDAMAILAAKENLRVLECGEWRDGRTRAWDYKRVTGGMLVQERDDASVAEKDLKLVTRRKPDAQQLSDLLFAWKVVKFVKSNAIVYAREGRTLGIGAGQMSRVVSSRLAAMKAEDAGLSVKGAVMASDAFFPFRDGLDQAAEVGVSAVIQPGGSLRDREVIDAADEHGITMVFTGIRHFRH